MCSMFTPILKLTTNIQSRPRYFRVSMPVAIIGSTVMMFQWTTRTVTVKKYQCGQQWNASNNRNVQLWRGSPVQSSILLYFAEQSIWNRSHSTRLFYDKHASICVTISYSYSTLQSQLQVTFKFEIFGCATISFHNLSNHAWTLCAKAWALHTTPHMVRLDRISST